MIMSDRDEFVGVHVTPAAKEALEREKQRTGKSVSRLVWEATRAWLVEAGHDVPEAPEKRAA